MKKIIIAVAVAVAAMSSAYAQMPLRVMTFNIRYGTAPDGKNSWQHRKELAAETIRKIDPDILGMQECLEMQKDFLATALPGYEAYGIGREKNGKGEMAAVMYKKDILQPIDKGYYWLSETPDVPGSMGWDAQCTRITTWIRFKHLPTKREFLYLNTHFDHKGETARINSANMVTERYKDENAPIILTGDFNVPAENSTPYETLKNAGFDDAWVAAAKKDGPSQTFGGYKPPDPEKSGRIDWIMYRAAPGAGKTVVPYCATVTYNDSGRFPSDHYPVYAELVFD